MKITLHGGACKIGGNKILLESHGRVFLDFGVDFNAKNMFFGVFLQPRRFSLIEDYISTGVLPPLKSLYINDGSPPPVDAVVVSHGHVDHYGHVSLLREDIPVYMGETTMHLIKARETTKQKSPEHLFNTETPHTVQLFRTGSRFEVGDISFEPIHVDHSIPAAYGFVMETDGGVVAYSGDLRMHGPKAEMTHDFVRRCVEKDVDVLLIEGTKMGETDFRSEEDVGNELRKVFEQAPGKLVSVVVGMMDFDRLNTVLKVAAETDRIAAISLHHAQILETLRQEAKRIQVPVLEENKLTAFVERRGTGTYAKKDYPSWMADLIDKVPKVTHEHLRSNQGKFLLVLSKAEDIIELSEVKPVEGSPFILSTSEPHSEEQVLEMDKITNWVNLLRLKYYHIHSSGHASQEHLIKIVEQISPRIIIPVHTEKPHLFEELVKERNIGSEVILLRQGESREFF